MMISGTSCDASTADLPVSAISSRSISSRCSPSHTAYRASTFARPLAPRAAHSVCAARRPAAMWATSAGSVQRTSPATSPVAGFLMVPVPVKEAGVCTSGVAVMDLC